jgi:hypothetical protein
VSAELARVLDESPYPVGVVLRFSYLKAMGRSPAHALNSVRSDYEPSLAMRIGTGAHSLLLGGPDIAVYPGKVRRGKDWDAYELEHANDIILNESEAETARAINEAVRANKLACQVLFGDGMIYENTIRWQWMGRDLRCTPDARSGRHIVDLKTTRDAEPERFLRDATRMGYHAQIALYGLAMEAATGRKPRDHYIVAVENKPPHCVTVLSLTPRAIEQGEKLCREWMTKFQECERANSWPGYTESIVPFDVLDGLMDELIFEDDTGEAA